MSRLLCIDFSFLLFAAIFFLLFFVLFLLLFAVHFLLLSLFLLLTVDSIVKRELQFHFGALPTLPYVSLPLLVVLSLLFSFLPPTTLFLLDVWLPLLIPVDSFLSVSNQLALGVALFDSSFYLD